MHSNDRSYCQDIVKNRAGAYVGPCEFAGAGAGAGASAGAYCKDTVKHRASVG